MADDDFDIDIYGDTNDEIDGIFNKDDEGGIFGGEEHAIRANGKEKYEEYVEIKVNSNDHMNLQDQQQIKSTDESRHDLLTIPKQAPQQQGVKRKEGSDDRIIDSGATTALLISDLHWWNTDDDIRGWVNQAQCEDELKDVTFSEHKINGKSKGQAYVEFTSQQAATAVKHKIDAFSEGRQYVKKHTVTYSSPNVNPFRTLPKDAPMRDSKSSQSNHSTAGAYSNRNGQAHNFRGRGSGYSSNRGNMSNNAGGNFNRNFSGSQMGNIAGGVQPSMGGFQGNQMSGPYGFNRGGMMGGMRAGSSNMRGGRGGMGGGMMMGMPMGGIPMGGMPIGAMGGAMVAMATPMGMGQMGGGMPVLALRRHRPKIGEDPDANSVSEYSKYDPSRTEDAAGTYQWVSCKRNLHSKFPKTTGIPTLNLLEDPIKGSISGMPLDSGYIVPQPIDGDDPRSLQGHSCECYRRYRINTDALPFFGFATLTLFILLLCALLTGLTLAVCSLDMVWLQVMSVTGDKKQRNQAIKISRIKRNANWFLCSMVMCSVACTEALPMLVQSLCGTAWLPLVLSIVGVAVFAELIPQYIIPRNAMFWAYYCWPFIWGCMWLTCVISWPVSFLLDRIAWPCVSRGIYTSEQLGVMIKFHESAEKHGGHLGPDAGRVMRGALDLDGRLIQGTNPIFCENGRALAADLERGNAAKCEIIVPWTAVRLIGINEEVTLEFVVKVRGWAYSRIPVVGDDVLAACNGLVEPERSRKGQKVYGFLHIKNLVGLELVDNNSKRLLVKDLPLYPLPIVRDDLPLYDLLNMFQFGMSRMAVVIRRPIKDQVVPFSASGKTKHALPRHSAPLWSAAGGLSNRSTIEMQALDAQIDWTTDFLDAAQNDIKMPVHRKHSIVGIRCPNPIGIVTYEDVLDTLLQKTSKDEQDFFGRHASVLHHKTKKAGDDISVSSNRSIIRTKKEVPSYLTEAQENGGETQGTLRRRNVSTAVAGNDGADETNDVTPNRAEIQPGVLHAQVLADRSSSYTQNSLGGFHRMGESLDDIEDIITQNLNVMACPNITQGLSTNASAISPAGELPSNSDLSSFKPLTTKSVHERSITMPRLRRVTPFLKKSASIFDSRPCPDPYGRRSSGADSETAGVTCERDKYAATILEDNSENSGPIVPFSTSKHQRVSTQRFRHEDDGEIVAARPGTRLSLFPGSSEENHAPEDQSKKIRRESLVSRAVALSNRDVESLLPSQENIRDDRTSLPSQTGQILQA